MQGKYAHFSPTKYIEGTTKAAAGIIASLFLSKPLKAKKKKRKLKLCCK